jgi:hypothetical protein
MMSAEYVVLAGSVSMDEAARMLGFTCPGSSIFESHESVLGCYRNGIVIVDSSRARGKFTMTKLVYRDGIEFPDIEKEKGAE